MERLGEKLKYAIENQYNGSKEKFAKELGVSSQTLYNMFERDDIEVKRLIKICKILGVDLGYFVNDSPITLKVHKGGTTKDVDSLKDRYIQKLEEDVAFLKDIIQQYGLGKWLRNMQAATGAKRGKFTVSPGMLSAQSK